MAFYHNEQRSSQTKYIELKEDFVLDNGSVLKKGCVLKVDKSMNESFTRYILYVNYKGTISIEAKTFDLDNFIKPYWMNRDTSANK